METEYGRFWSSTIGALVIACVHGPKTARCVAWLAADYENGVAEAGETHIIQYRIEY
jgi:hypothetical protein